MSDAFYTLVRALGYPIVSVASDPTVLHEPRLSRIDGPAILAPNHLSPYDVPCLMAATRRRLDFVSSIEFFRPRPLGRFMTAMNAMPLRRGHVDPTTTRDLLRRLERGRTVVMFPEGRIRDPADSLLSGAAFTPSIVRIAQRAPAPIVPCVLLGTGAFGRPAAWLPLRRTRYAVAFGYPIPVPPDSPEPDTIAAMRAAYAALYTELHDATSLTIDSTPWRK